MWKAERKGEQILLSRIQNAEGPYQVLEKQLLQIPALALSNLDKPFDLYI